MELRLLQYFLTVATEATISGAAKALHVTQPTLSRQMKGLEDELGVKLFIRGNRRIVLTDEGIRFRKRAEEIIDLVEKTESEFLTPSEVVSGDIYIGGGETYIMKYIARIIKSLQAEHPMIRFHIYSGNAEDVTERLDKGLLDFGLLIEPTNLSKYESLRLPFTDVWGVLMRKESPLAKLDAIQPKDLLSVPILISHQRLVSDAISGWFKTDYKKLNLVSTYNLVYNASLLVEEGIGYALCLDRLVNTTGNSNLCFRPLNPKLESHVDIVWKKHQVFSKAADIFQKKLQNEFLT